MTSVSSSASSKMQHLSQQQCHIPSVMYVIESDKLNII